MSDGSLADYASILSSTAIGVGILYIALRQFHTDRERLIHDRFDRRFVVYKATDDFIRKGFTHGLTMQEVVEFYNVTKEAYFLFDDSLASYLENEVLSKGNQIASLGEDRQPSDVRERRELTEWMRHQRIPAREKFAKFLRL
jgi:hypothetical protein